MSDRCGRGHEFTADNTLVDRNGRRNCRTCTQARNRANHERTAAAQGPASWMADDVDEVVVQRYLKGEAVGRRLHHAEKLEIVRRYIRGPHGAEGLSYLLRSDARTVQRLIEEATA